MFAPKYIYRHVATMGGKGSGPAEFASELRGVAVDAQGAVYAAGDREIKKFDAAGRIARRWSTVLPPLCVATATDGTVWAGEAGLIQIFDGAGKLLDTWQDDKLLGRVTAIGFHADSVFVGDAAARCIRHSGRRATFRNNIGDANSTNGLLIPNGVVDFSVDASGIVFAANPGKHRVERYSPSGELLGHIGRFTGPDPTGFSGCCNPTNVTVVPHAGIAVTEKAGPRGKLYDLNGALLAFIDGDLFDPMCKNMDIAAGNAGRLYIADTVKLHVLVFDRVAVGGPS